MTNSADQISWLLQKPTDLDLHCLLRQGVSCLAREGLIVVLSNTWTLLLTVVFSSIKYLDTLLNS